jgi:hypothetical protein
MHTNAMKFGQINLVSDNISLSIVNCLVNKAKHPYFHQLCYASLHFSMQL